MCAFVGTIMVYVCMYVCIYVCVCIGFLHGSYKDYRWCNILIYVELHNSFLPLPFGWGIFMLSHHMSRSVYCTCTCTFQKLIKDSDGRIFFCKVWLTTTYM